MQFLKSFNIFKNVTNALITILTLVTGVICLYEFYLKDKKTKINIEIHGNTNVLDINETISQLDIMYRGESLIKKNQNLRIYTVKIINIGSEPIIKNYYDLEDPIGIKISNGIIIEKPRFQNASNEYIQKHLNISFKEDLVCFNALILEPNDYYTIKILVLHNNLVSPELISSGKIAGMKKIDLYYQLQGDNNKESIKAKIFSGGKFVNLLKFVVFGLLFLCILIMLVFAFVKSSEIFKKIKKKKAILDFTSKFTEYKSYTLPFLKKYKDDNYFLITELIQHLNSSDDLNIEYNLCLQNRLSQSKKISSFAGQQLSIINKLIDDDYVRVKDNALVVNDVYFDALRKFYDFLKEENYPLNYRDYTLNT